MKQVLKKALCTVLCLAVILAVCCGCSSEGDTHGLKKNSPVTIMLWHYYNGAQQQAFDDLVSEFNDTVGKEKGIIVQSKSQGKVNELITKAMDALDNKVGADEFPDMLAAYADTAYEINQRGMAADISQYMSEEELGTYVEEYMEEGRFNEDGGYKLFPVAKSTEVFMLNETEWEEFSKSADVSDESFSTWEGLVEVAKKYYEYTDGLTPDVPNDGKAFFGRDAMANYPIVGSMQLGTELFSVKDGKVTYQVDKDVMRRIWDNYYTPYINGWFSASGQFRSDDVKTGELIACVGSTSSAKYFPSQVTCEDGSVYDIGVKVYPVPNFEGTKPYAVQQGAGMLITKSNEQKEYASIVFLKWFTEAENNLKFCVGSGYLPVKREANDLEKVKAELDLEQEPQDSALYQTLCVGTQMVQDYTFYTNKAFENGTASRNLVESSFLEKIEADRARVDELVAGGAGRGEAAAQIDTDENFTAWYEKLVQDLNALGQ